jgi:hypothetical protein
MTADWEDRDKSRAQRLLLDLWGRAAGGNDRFLEEAMPLLAAHEDAVRADRDMDWWRELVLCDAIAPTPEAAKAWLMSICQDEREVDAARAEAAEQGKREAEALMAKYREELVAISGYAPNEGGIGGTVMEQVQAIAQGKREAEEQREYWRKVAQTLGVDFGALRAKRDDYKSKYEAMFRVSDPLAKSLRDQLSDARAKIERLRGERDEWKRAADQLSTLHAEQHDMHMQTIEYAQGKKGELKQAQRRAEVLEKALRGLLLSADASWEANGAGHDWADAAVSARAALQGTEPREPDYVVDSPNFEHDGVKALAARGYKRINDPRHPGGTEPQPFPPYVEKRRLADTCEKCSKSPSVWCLCAITEGTEPKPEQVK